MTVALVLSGGGSKGDFELGAVRGLDGRVVEGLGIAELRLAHIGGRAPADAEPAGVVDAEIARIAEAYQQEFETLKQTLRKNGTTLRIRDEIRERKTLDYLIGEYAPDGDTPEDTKE